MKLNVILFLLFVTGGTLVYSQQEKQSLFSIFVASGLIQNTTTDGKLNYYNYSGNTIMPLNVSGSCLYNKSLFTVNIFFNKAKLQPNNLPVNYYTYNNIEHINASLNIEYFKQIADVNSNIQVFIGIKNSSSITMQQENYKNILYSNAEGFRKSYSLSAISLSPVLQLNYSFTRNKLIIKTSYALLNYTSRPDDNYVKQIGLNNQNYWGLYSVKAYKECMCSIFYQYFLFNNYGVTAEFNTLYISNSSSVEYKYLRNSFFLGLFKSF